MRPTRARAGAAPADLMRERFFGRVPAPLREWRRHLEEGLELAAVADDWSAAEGYAPEAFVNTRFTLGQAEARLLETLHRQSGRPRWAIVTAALEQLSQIPRPRSAGTGGGARARSAAAPHPSPAEIPPVLPLGARGTGLCLAERNGDWNACGAYPDEEFVMTRFVVAAETGERIRELAARHGVPQRVVLTAALHALKQAVGFVTQTAPDSAIARRWPPQRKAAARIPDTVWRPARRTAPRARRRLERYPISLDRIRRRRSSFGIPGARRFRGCVRLLPTGRPGSVQRPCARAP